METKPTSVGQRYKFHGNVYRVTSAPDRYGRVTVTWERGPGDEIPQVGRALIDSTYELLGGGPSPGTEGVPWKIGQRRRGDIVDIGVKGLLYEVAGRCDTVGWYVKALEAHSDNDGSNWPAGGRWYASESWPSVLLPDVPSPEVPAFSHRWKRMGCGTCGANAGEPCKGTCKSPCRCPEKDCMIRQVDHDHGTVPSGTPDKRARWQASNDGETWVDLGGPCSRHGCSHRYHRASTIMPATAEQTARDDSGNRPTKPAHSPKREVFAGGAWLDYDRFLANTDEPWVFEAFKVRRVDGMEMTEQHFGRNDRRRKPQLGDRPEPWVPSVTDEDLLPDAGT